jgi:hypothetical protein
MELQSFIQKATGFYKTKGFELQDIPDVLKLHDLKVQFFQKSVKAGIFKGSDNYLLIQADPAGTLKKEKVSEIHEAFRAYINSKIRTPRVWRFSVPNIITVICSEQKPDDDLVSYIRSIRRPWQGGEVHNIVFIDVTSMSVYGHGTTEYNIEGLFTMPMKNVDPSNRSFYFVREMCAWMRINKA